FGVVKRHFRLMVAAPEYSLSVQTKLVPALCVLHNFIWVHDPNDEEDLDLLDEAHANQVIQVVHGRPRIEDFGQSITPAERERAARKHDDIAEAMWLQYTEYTTNSNQN
ncbi:hypothetical protein BDR04DRAFT_1005441, partial [Suillus decipiens]